MVTVSVQVRAAVLYIGPFIAGQDHITTSGFPLPPHRPLSQEHVVSHVDIISPRPLPRPPAHPANPHLTATAATADATTDDPIAPHPAAAMTGLLHVPPLSAVLHHFPIAWPPHYM